MKNSTRTLPKSVFCVNLFFLFLFIEASSLNSTNTSFDKSNFDTQTSVTNFNIIDQTIVDKATANCENDYIKNGFYYEKTRFSIWKF